MEAVKLKLENKDGKTLRTFLLNTDESVVVYRKDNKRIELVPDTQDFQKNKIQFDELGIIKKSALSNLDFLVPGVGVIRSSQVNEVTKDYQPADEDEKVWWGLLGFTIFAVAAFVGFVLTRDIQTEKIEQELKQEVVKIIKTMPVTKRPNTTETVSNQTVETPKNMATKNTNTLKRMGALAILGSLKTGNQKGGINLLASKVSAGPGLGGTQGSGGVQTTLYGKGLVAAPVGAGNNLQGGGGYGTKGKGGGQAGYGSMSLIGSSGVDSMPLAKEAVIGGGLDRSLIADVINRNLGQIRFCYEQGLQGNPSLAGRVSVGFTIGASGVVKSSNIENSTLGSKMVEDCIMMRLKTWKFPLTEGGVDVKVSYPFVLKRTGQG